ncbi:MAG: hypothetical protein HY372_02385 [Candidatus Andersenbacteria bacterium]|nr:hypothetical protein [Candidatus Andersenbacteria bacterium]
MATDSAGGVLPTLPFSRLPVLLALVSVALGGIFLLNRADTQARDTIRKHHLEDLEQALYFARAAHGTFPPYNQPNWCGLLNTPASSPVRAQIEAALRAQNAKYANPDKPFPHDPQSDRAPSEALAKEGQSFDYFYWKRNPAIFELYAILETDPNAERNTTHCNSVPQLVFDYGITSIWRENP